MDFDTSMSGNLSSKQSLNGNIKFIVHNGRMGTLGKLEHLLSHCSFFLKAFFPLLLLLRLFLEGEETLRIYNPLNNNT